uniref:Uncharacterized protein n=1 Tax=Octopus bimaculoides TaxID=37653 RepID=A0A0L8GIE6_OCTBM
MFCHLDEQLMYLHLDVFSGTGFCLSKLVLYHWVKCILPCPAVIGCFECSMIVLCYHNKIVLHLATCSSAMIYQNVFSIKDSFEKFLSASQLSIGIFVKK